MYLSKKYCFVNTFSLISSFNSLADFWFLHNVSCLNARKYLYHQTLDQDDLMRIDFKQSKAKQIYSFVTPLCCRQRWTLKQRSRTSTTQWSTRRRIRTTPWEINMTLWHNRLHQQLVEQGGVHSWFIVRWSQILWVFCYAWFSISWYLWFLWLWML